MAGDLIQECACHYVQMCVRSTFPKVLYIAYQSESDNLRFDQNIVGTRGAELHKEAQDNMDDHKSDPSASLK